MILQGLQSYFGPLTTLFVFTGFILTDRLFSPRIRRLFFFESLLIFVIILTKWTDGCLSALQAKSTVLSLRKITNFLDFFLSPLSPVIFISIYSSKHKKTIGTFFFFLPILISMIISILSLKFGLLFKISTTNNFIYGPLFFIPFVAAYFYLIALIFLSWNTKIRKKHLETIILCIIGAITGISTLLEVFFHVHFIVWSTTEICVILYFLFLTIQKIIYEPMTGTYSREYYDRTIKYINRKKNCIIAVIDINSLKTINDDYGHKTGDDAICRVSKTIIKYTDKKMSVFRTGGDEFVLISQGNDKERVIQTLKNADADCKKQLKPYKLSFAWGIVTYNTKQNLPKLLSQADSNMYTCKKRMKLFTANYDDSL